MQVIVLFCSMILILSFVLSIKLFISKDRRLAARWGCSALVFLVLITAYFTPTSFRWDVPTNETTIRIHCDLSTFHLSNPQQKESLITALSSTPFFRPFFNSNHGSYDPQRETHFLISFHSEQKYAKVWVAFSAIDHSILFIETDTGLHSKGTNSLHDIFCEIFAL